MKQTAVEWMAAHVNHVIDLHKRKLISEDKFRSLLIEYREQAKQMEKEKMIEFTSNYVLTQCSSSFEGNVTVEMTTEEYYELTFKTK